MKVIPLQSITHHPHFDEIIEKMRTALQYFPEIKMPVYIGIQTNENVYARADPVNQIIFWHYAKKPRYVTAFHELAHIAVYRHNMLAKLGFEDKWPETEEFASILAMSRMPSSLIDEKRIPYVAEIQDIHLKEIPRLCVAALEYRKRKRNYIQFLRKKLKEMAKITQLAVKGDELR